MFGFPISTDFGRRIPKQKFYEHIDISAQLKRDFIDQIQTINWNNKLATTTLNIAAGESVTEIEVFEIRLHTPHCNEVILRQIDKAIPYHILFVLTFEGKAQAWIGYKEATATGNNAFKIGRYYHTDWLPEDELQFHVEGLSVDSVYENLVRQVAGDRLQTDTGEELQVSIERDEHRHQLEKQIAALEKKLKKEKQLNRRMEINNQIKKIKIQFND